MASLNTFSLGDIIQVELPEEEHIKCFGMTLERGGTRSCEARLGKARKQSARGILQKQVFYQDLGGGLVRIHLKDLAQLLVRCNHASNCRGDLEQEWMRLLERHREAQEAKQETEQLHEAETSQCLPVVLESTDSPASIVQAPTPESHSVSYPELPHPEADQVTTPPIQDARQEALPQPPVLLQNVQQQIPAHHPTPFARRVPTYPDDYPVSLSSNWILSYLITVLMQSCQSVLALVQEQLGTVSKRDEAGRIRTEPVTHLKFLLGVDFSVGRLNFASCMYALLILAMFRLVFSVFWPLSGYVAGLYVILEMSGMCKRSPKAIEQ
jgi:hypothetical protein